VVAGSADFYMHTLDALCDAIEALDTSPYSWASSDRWRRARRLDDPSQTAHLEFMVDLGGWATSRPHVAHAARLVVWCRYVADDDLRSQARSVAAIRAVEMLLRQWGAFGARTLPIAVERGETGSDWVQWILAFNLHYEVS